MPQFRDKNEMAYTWRTQFCCWCPAEGADARPVSWRIPRLAPARSRKSAMRVCPCTCSWIPGGNLWPRIRWRKASRPTISRPSRRSWRSTIVSRAAACRRQPSINPFSLLIFYWVYCSLVKHTRRIIEEKWNRLVHWDILSCTKNWSTFVCTFLGSTLKLFFMHLKTDYGNFHKVSYGIKN